MNFHVSWDSSMFWRFISILIVIFCVMEKNRINNLAEELKIKESPPQKLFPLFSDLDEGFEEEIKFLRENVLLPFANREIYEAGGVLSLPRDIYFSGEGAAELVVRALANEGGFNFTEINANERISGLHIYPEKRTELENIFANLEKNAPSILLTHGTYSPISNKNEERQIWLKMLENISGKILVIRIIPKDPSMSNTRYQYPLTYVFPDEGLSPGKRETILKLSTHTWKFAPSSQILKEVASCEKLGSKEEIGNLAYSVYDYVMKSKLLRRQNETVSIEIDPSLNDWLEVMKDKFGSSCTQQGSQRSQESTKKSEVDRKKDLDNINWELVLLYCIAFVALMWGFAVILRLPSE